VAKKEIKQYLIIFLVAITIFFICMEFYTRYQSKNGRSGNEVKILYEEKFPEVDKFLADKRLAGSGGCRTMIIFSLQQRRHRLKPN